MFLTINSVTIDVLTALAELNPAYGHPNWGKTACKAKKPENSENLLPPRCLNWWIELSANILKPFSQFASWVTEWVVVLIAVVAVLVTLVAVVGVMQSIRTMPQNDPNAGESCHKQPINCTQRLPKARGGAGGGGEDTLLAVWGHILPYPGDIVPCMFRSILISFSFLSPGNAIDIAFSLSLPHSHSLLTLW